MLLPIEKFKYLCFKIRILLLQNTILLHQNKIWTFKTLLNLCISEKIPKSNNISSGERDISLLFATVPDNLVAINRGSILQSMQVVGLGDTSMHRKKSMLCSHRHSDVTISVLSMHRSCASYSVSLILMSIWSTISSFLFCSSFIGIMIACAGCNLRCMDSSRCVGWERWILLLLFLLNKSIC